MNLTRKCSKCGETLEVYKNPVPTVDIIIELYKKGKYLGIVLIDRKNPPYGWAIPGGFVDYGGTLEAAAAREAKEETTLKVENLKQFRAYSDPDRDPRQHTISYIFTARSNDTPIAADDAKGIGVFSLESLPENIVFDHDQK